MKKRWIFPLLAIAVIGGSWAMLGRGNSPAQAASANEAPAVTVAQVLLRQVEDTDEFTGLLQAVDAIQLRPRVNGYVDSAHFVEGAIVHKGELLFQIDPRPYQAEVDRLQANLRQARAELVLARSNAQRAETLLDQHAMSREEADRQTTAAQSAQGQVEATAAALAAAQLNREFTEVRAPIDGRVGNALINPGNLVTSSDVLTTLVTVNPVYAYFDVDENSFLRIDRLRRQQGSAPAVAMELADESGFPHTGHIDFVDNQLRASSGTIRLRAVFDNSDGSYTPGLYVRLQLRTPNKQPRALIDDRAVGTDQGNKFVYVVDKDNKVSYRKVSTGPLLDGLRVITEGLNANDVVIVNGLQHVRPGAQVTPSKITMASRRLDFLSPQVAQGAPVGGLHAALTSTQD